MPQLHPDANAILARLRKEGITALYHFTCVENLSYICQTQELWSKQKLEDEGKWPSLIPGGNSLSHRRDRYNGNWDKVSLSLTPFTPMAYHKKRKDHLCYFIIRPEVATWTSVVFTDSNAASNGQRRDEGPAGLNYIHFDAIRSIPFAVPDWKKFVQAEVLVPESISFAYVTEVSFVSKASMAYAEQLCGTLLRPSFTVKGQLFSDSPKASQGTIGFPYALELIVSDTIFDKNVLYLSHLHKNTYSKSYNKHVILVASVRALTGTKGSFVMYPTTNLVSGKQVIGVVDFEKPSQYLHQHEILLSSLPIGSYLVQYCLNELCWASTTFEVVK